MTAEKYTSSSNEQFAAAIADKMLTSKELLENAGFSRDEMVLVINELKKNADVAFALELVQRGTKIEEVEDIGNNRYMMQLALSIHNSEVCAG